MKHFIVVAVVVFLFVPLLEIRGDNTLTISPNLNEVSTEAEKTETITSEEEDLVLRKWRIMEGILQESTSRAVKSIFPFIAAVSEKVNISSQCSKSILKMMYGIKKMQTWAFRMIDASGKIPNGMLSGSLTSLGDFDGCLSVDVSGPNPFRGQYCSVFINPPLPKYRLFHKGDEILPEFVNFTKKGTVIDEMVRRAPHFYLASIRTSVCVPSTCSREEIGSIIDTMVVSVGFPWNVSVPTCDVIEPVVLSKGNIAVICILSAIALLVLAGTIMDIYLNIFHKEERAKVEATSATVKCLICFSAYNNTLRLLKKDTSPDSINIFHGMKVITILWVVQSHIYGYTSFAMTSSMKNMDDFFKQFAFQVNANAFFDVETFFFISAVLVAYRRMKFMGDHINVPLYVYHRLWRLTPTFMLVIATSMLIPHLGSGPGWKEIVGSMTDKCKENWWTNLVYINNFIPSEKMCFEWFWYIPVDTHLYFIALLVLIPMKRWTKLALGINGVLFFGGTIVTAATHVYYKQTPTVVFSFPDRRDINYFLEKSYFRTYVHIPAYCIGLYTGFVLSLGPKLKIPKVLNICGWLISVTLGLLVVYGSYDWNKGNVPVMAVSTLYACTCKVLWTLALSYVTIACCTGNGGVITSVLSWSAFVPLSRLTFALYLVHPIVHFMYVGSTRALINVDHKTFTYLYFGTTVMSLMVAYAVSMMFESPLMCLSKVLLSGGKSARKPESENHVKKFDESKVSVISMKKIENGMP